MGEKQIHPEFIQNEMNVANLLKAYYESNPQVFFAKVEELRAYLKHGSRNNVAEILTKLLKL